MNKVTNLVKVGRCDQQPTVARLDEVASKNGDDVRTRMKTEAEECEKSTNHEAFVTR